MKNKFVNGIMAILLSGIMILALEYIIITGEDLDIKNLVVGFWILQAYMVYHSLFQDK